MIDKLESCEDSDTKQSDSNQATLQTLEAKMLALQTQLRTVREQIASNSYLVESNSTSTTTGTTSTSGHFTSPTHHSSNSGRGYQTHSQYPERAYPSSGRGRGRGRYATGRGFYRGAPPAFGYAGRGRGRGRSSYYPSAHTYVAGAGSTEAAHTEEVYEQQPTGSEYDGDGGTEHHHQQYNNINEEFGGEEGADWLYAGMDTAAEM